MYGSFPRPAQSNLAIVKAEAHIGARPGLTPPVPAAYAARAGLSVINEIGPRAIHEWATYLSSRILREAARLGLTVHGTTDPACKTPTTAIVCEGDAAASASTAGSALG